jgi:hypothetical protein
MSDPNDKEEKDDVYFPHAAATIRELEAQLVAALVEVVEEEEGDDEALVA